MSKRTAQEAFPKAPVSAFAAARARKAAQLPAEVAVPAETEAVLEEAIGSEEAHEIDSNSEDDLQSNEGPDSGKAPSSLPKERLTTTKLPPSIKPDAPLHLTLKAGHFVTCNGGYMLKVIAGAVSVYGAYVTANSPECEIFAPSTHALPGIVSRFDDTKIQLRPHRSGLQSLQKLSPLWNRVWPRNATFSVVLESGDSAEALNAAGLAIEPVVQDTFNRLSNSKITASAPRILVTGGKSAGKSTFCRTLLNSILTSPSRTAGSSCLWLDLDPGQPEFSSGGQISLVQVRQPVFGPAFTHALTHPALPYRTILAHSLAAASPREDMAHYLACAKSLMQRYMSTRRSHNNAPLIINCPGWIAGSGGDLVKCLVADLDPTEVVVLDSADAATQELSEMLQALPGKRLITSLPARQNILRSRPAAELRAMQAMAYHHASVTGNGSLVWTPTPIGSASTWTASYAGENQAIEGIISYYDPIPLEHLCTVLPYSPISIVAIHTDEAFSSDDSAPAYTTARSPEDLPLLLPSSGTGIFPPLTPSYSSCLGQAIITQVDTTKKQLQLATPVSEAEIAAVRSTGARIVLIRGKLPVPDWAVLESVHVSSSVAPEDFDLSDDEGAGPAEPTPYITVRNTGTGEDDPAARAVGESVWRPRFLPRKTG